MKVIYYSYTYFADCDFPLIKELLSKGVDVRVYMALSYDFQKSSILEFQRPLKRWGIIKASKLEYMQPYENCLDLERLYFICGNGFFKLFTPFLWFFAYLHMLSYKADILHITWQLDGFERIIKYLPIRKKIMTIHDPIQHSSVANADYQEKRRIETFKWIDRFILLSNCYVKTFADKYSIPLECIRVTRLGAYDSISFLNFHNDIPAYSKNAYVLFFGAITPYKGIEYLLSAMEKVHDVYPNIHLLIAGSGSIYFDDTRYKQLEYVKIENRYIGIMELVSMIRGCLFVVCPYKDATQSGVVQTAFVLNTPVIATNVGSLPNTVIDEKYGKIVPPCNSEALSEAMISLIDNPKRLAEFKKNINTEWLPLMSWSKIADDYIDVYNHEI